MNRFEKEHKERLEQERFTGSYKTQRASYKEFNNLWSLWFGFGFKNQYKITRELIKGKSYFAVWNENTRKIIFKIEIK